MRDVVPDAAEIYLRGAFGILATLCAMMVLWILGLPATWRAGWAWHDRLVAAWYERSIQTLGHFPTPLNLITKYKGHSVAQLHQPLLPSVTTHSCTLSLDLSLSSLSLSHFLSPPPWESYEVFS